MLESLPMSKSEKVKAAAQTSRQLLNRYIQEGIIDPEQLGWGKGIAKSREDLERELDSGDSILTPFITPDGQNTLLRHVKPAYVYAFAYRRKYGLVGKKQLYVLHEDWQKFRRHGKPKKERNNYYVSEKMHPEETPEHEAQRALEEELGLKNLKKSRFIILRPEEEVKEPAKSSTYPGIWSEKIMIRSSILLFGRREVRRRYYEKQEDKTTRFSWKRVDKVDNDRVQEYARQYRRDKP